MFLYIIILVSIVAMAISRYMYIHYYLYIIDQYSHIIMLLLSIRGIDNKNRKSFLCYRLAAKVFISELPATGRVWVHGMIVR